MVQGGTSQDGALEAMKANDDDLPPPEQAASIEGLDPWWTASSHSQQTAGRGSNSSTSNDSGSGSGNCGGGSNDGIMDRLPAGSGAGMADDIKLGKDVP